MKDKILTSEDAELSLRLEKLNALKRELTDLLLDNGHTISKPMIDELAIYIYHKEDRATYKQNATQTSSTIRGE